MPDQALEVIMRSAKRQEKLLVAKFEAEARRLAGRISENQMRFLQVAKGKGAELEPVGPLAGASS
ncbi:hypothetical protein D3C76_934240 [compost metagenome]